MVSYARNAVALSGDIDRWRALAEQAADYARRTSLQPVMLYRLRQRRDDANRAVVIGADGEANPCRRLMEVVNAACDPRLSQGRPDGLLERALEVLARCQAYEAVRRAGRQA